VRTVSSFVFLGWFVSRFSVFHFTKPFFPRRGATPWEAIFFKYFAHLSLIDKIHTIGDHFKCNDKQAHLERCIVVYKLNPLTTAIGRPFFGHKSPTARARELFKPSTDSASLLVDIEKKSFSFSMGVFWR